MHDLTVGVLSQITRMFVIETASRAHFFIKSSKVRKVNHAFLPGGIQIEDLTLASCHAK